MIQYTRYIKAMKFLMLILFLLMLITLPACGGSGQASSAQGGEGASQADAAAGKQLFVSSCAACHGVGGEGITGLGKPLTTSEFVGGLSDE
jgi:mono/diheme cytochrome c family protein